MNAPALASPGFYLVDERASWGRDHVEATVESWARELRACGVAPREPVALVAQNHVASAAAILAIRRVGAVAAPLHPALAPDERVQFARRLGARLVLIDAASPVRDLATASLLTLDHPLKPPRLAGAPASIDGDYVLFTSGSEGRPKGVRLTDDGFRKHAEGVRERLPYSSRDRWLSTLSFAHVGGLALLLRAAHLGSGVVLPAQAYDLDATIRRHNVTHVPLVPTTLRRWLEASPAGSPPPSLRCILLGGAAAPAELVEAARRHRWPVRVTYGLTEAGSQVATAREDSPAGSAGPPLEGVSVKIEDDGRGQGRILVRSPGQCIGYLEGQGALRDGWLATDDLGRLDGQGNLWVLGRRSDTIITGGENVDPVEVEHVLSDHPAVSDVAVVGVPDPEWGEAVTALVVPREGHEVALEDLREHCARRLARFKCPKRLARVDRIPRTPTGKVRRSELRALAAGP